MDRDQFSSKLDGLLSSPLGKELIKDLSEYRSNLLAEAEEATASEQLKLLNRAYGVRLAIEQMRRVSSLHKFVPKDEGSKGFNKKAQ